MEDTITTIYCLCDDFLKAINHRDDPQVLLTTAEVMTIPLVAATFFGGNVEKARRFLKEYGYMPTIISKSHLNRRIHAIEITLWEGLFALFAQVFKQRNAEQTYVVDSLPVAVCDNILRSAAVGSIPPKKAPKRSVGTSRASGATSTVCACIWW
jgi:hypothetical protein